MGGRIDQTMRQLAEQMVWILPDHWAMVGLVREWRDFRMRYRDTMMNSSVTAESIRTILQEFEKVYLAQVESIQTEQDRLNAIAKMEYFISELDQWDKSQIVMRDLLQLKRDIDAFVAKFTTSMEQNVIAPFTSDIEAIDAEIIVAHNSIGILGGSGILRALELGAKVSNVIASLQYHRDKKAKALKEVRRAVTLLNELVAPLEKARPMDKSTELPLTDINAMLEDLVVFGEIWSAVRSQTVQFNEILGHGLDAATNTGFKLQVKLAREVCTPLISGLIEYVEQVWSWLQIPPWD